MVRTLLFHGTNMGSNPIKGNKWRWKIPFFKKKFMSVSLKALLCKINDNSYRLFLLTVSIVQIIFIFKVVFPSETLELSKLFFETWTKKPIDVIQEAVEPLEKSDISVDQMKSLFGSLRDITSEPKLYFGSCCLIIAGVS